MNSTSCPSDRYKWVALSCTTLGALLSVLNGSTLMIALPDIIRALHASVETVMWMVMGYMLALTILVPTIGRLADIYGRKRLYVSGFAVFTLFALVSGFARNADQLLAFRMLQAVGGALLLANSTAIVTDAFPKGELGRALGINSMIIAVGFTIGPILGGFLTHFGWSWVFWFNVPLGVAGTIWAWVQLRELERLPAGQRLDLWGTAAFTAGMFLLLWALTLEGFAGWTSPTVLGSLAGAIVLLAVFIGIESRTAQPLLDLRLFETRILAYAFIAILLNGIARGAVTFLLIFFLQGVKGIDPMAVGILMAPFALAMMVTAPIGGAWSDRYGARWPATIGLLISAVGLLGMSTIRAGTSVLEIILWSLIIGAGSGLFNSPNTSEIMGSVPPQRRGVAAGVRTMMNNVGSMLSIALAMAVASAGISPQALAGLLAGTQVGTSGIAVNEFVRGLRQAFAGSMVISLVAAWVSYLRGPRPVWDEEQASPAKTGPDEIAEQRA